MAVIHQRDMIDYIPRAPVEARNWLRTNRNPSALATNRFGKMLRAARRGLLDVVPTSRRVIGA